MILVCWLAGIACVPTIFYLREEVLSQDNGTKSQESHFILSHIFKVYINEKCKKAIAKWYDASCSLQ